jgi:hypothetical protein
MFSRLRRRLTYANVTATLALFLALGGGTAYAADTIFSTDIVDGEVKTQDLAALAVTVGKIGTDAVTQGKIQDNAVGTPAIATTAVREAEIGTNAVDAPELDAIADRTATVTFTGTSTRTGTATCNTGEQVVSGGVTGVDGRLDTKLIARSGNGWSATITNGGNQPETATVHAYCLVP